MKFYQVVVVVKEGFSNPEEPEDALTEDVPHPDAEEEYTYDDDEQEEY